MSCSNLWCRSCRNPLLSSCTICFCQKVNFSWKVNSSNKQFLSQSSCFSPWKVFYTILECSGSALHREYTEKFVTNIPRNETARPQSRLIHFLCFCERFIQYVPSIGLPILLQENSWTMGIYKSFTEIWMWKLTEAAQFLFWEHINRNLFAVCAVVCVVVREGDWSKIWTKKFQNINEWIAGCNWQFSTPEELF
jgi:hypothetical protein